MQYFEKIRALGTDVEIYLQAKIAKDFKTDIAEIKNLIINFEKSFSRFLDTSEVSRLNKTDGKFSASAEMIKIMLKAKKFHLETAGIFDPTILQTLKNVGYGKSFSLLDSDKSQWNNHKLSNGLNDEIGFQKIIIDKREGTILKPIGTQIDLGGIGKGYIVDMIVELIDKKGYDNYWISAGGDMHVSGQTEIGQLWQIGIQNPRALDKDIAKIQVPISGLAIATSGVAKRQWTINGQIKHHLIDPRTGDSAKNDLLAVTIITDTVTRADVYAKTVFILGPKKGIDFINEHQTVEGLLIDKNNKIILSKNISNYLIPKK